MAKPTWDSLSGTPGPKLKTKTKAWKTLNELSKIWGITYNNTAVRAKRLAEKGILEMRWYKGTTWTQVFRIK